MSLIAGERIDGRYEIVRQIGRSATAKIYLATDTETATLVALKIFEAAFLQEKTSLAEFSKKTAVARSLVHPNIIATYQAGAVTTLGTAYVAREYVEGPTLQDMIDQLKHIPPTQALSVFAPMCSALEYAHDRSIWHGNLNPKSVFVGLTECSVKILGFSDPQLQLPIDQRNCLAISHDAVGNPIYMSPERLMGKKADRRSDIYSLGCLLYEALAGRPPFRGKTSVDTAAQHMSFPPQPINELVAEPVPARLESAVSTCLQKDPQRRFQSAAELKLELLASVR